MASKVLLSAVELGLFTELASAPLDAGAIGRRLGLHPRGLRDFLDALVALGMLARNDGLYSNTPDTSFFLDRAKPAYIGGLLEMFNGRLYNFYGSLTEALKTGQPQNESKQGGANIFAQLYGDPARLRQFLGAMTGISQGSGRAIAAEFPWQDYRTFADVGCAKAAVPYKLRLRIRISTAWVSICRRCNQFLRSTPRRSASPAACAFSRAASLAIPCPPRTCWSWATFSITGTWRPSACFLVRPTKPCPPTAY